MKRKGSLSSNFVVMFSVFVACTVFSLPGVSFAQIAIGNQTGTIKITAPDGNVITVEKGQPLPDVASGSKVEVVSGSANILATEGDVLTVVLNDKTVSVQNAEISVYIAFDSGNANISVVSGDVVVTNPDGSTQTLTQGSVQSVSAQTPANTAAVAEGVPGVDPTQTVARNEDAEQGEVTGY
ncbi:MAG: hypothetical protein HY586_01775 [Candidatus Omnitrophica bacterium]|nr:hypothetical protein [Candidatus Omnitrophota bacterium]